MHRNPTIDDPIYPAAKVATALFDQYVCSCNQSTSAGGTTLKPNPVQLSTDLRPSPIHGFNGIVRHPRVHSEEPINNCLATKVRILFKRKSDSFRMCTRVDKVKQLTMQILITSPPTIIPTKM